MKLKIPFTLFAAAVLLKGSLVAAQPAGADPASNTGDAAAKTNSPTNTPAAGFILDDKHKLAPGDKISFRIIEDRDPAISVTVTDSGELDVPYAGPGFPPLRVKAANKTCFELGHELKKLLEQDYYYRANVFIGLDAVSKVRGKVYIWGQVRTQGAVDIPTEEKFTVGKAILRAGGFGDFADKKRVKLIRTLPDGTKKEEVLDMIEILEKGKTEKDKTLQEDDFIIVPEKLWNF
jgi:protein involved in polysaccharide export with SLBB domain